MSDAKAPPASLEDIGAGLVNGVMVTLLGVALTGVFTWQVVAQFSGWLPDLNAATAGLPAVDFSALPDRERRALIRDSLGALWLLLASFWAIRWGVGHIRENLAHLGARRG